MSYHQQSTDQELRDGCRSGDRRACELLYRRYFGKLLGISMRYTGSKDEATAILNQAFLKIFQSLDQYREEGSFAGWMSTIVFRTTMNELRRKGKQPSTVEMQETHAQAVKNTAEDRLDAEEIYRYVQALPEKYRTVFSLYVVEGYTHQEIARQLDIKVGNSRARLKQARELLKVSLAAIYKFKGHSS